MVFRDIVSKKSENMAKLNVIWNMDVIWNRSLHYIEESLKYWPYRTKNSYSQWRIVKRVNTVSSVNIINLRGIVP